MNKPLFESTSIQLFNMLGIKVNALSMPQLNALIDEAILLKKRWIIANHNLHSIYLYHHEAKMRTFYAQADYTHIDGMALVLLGQFLGLPLQREHRVTYADWTEPLMAEAAQKGWRVFYLGSYPGVAEQGAKILKDRFPNLQIATADGYFNASLDSQENYDRLAKINAYQPDILMVGMSMPRQENWIIDNLDKISAHVILPSGAAIDYIAGAVSTPPRWAGKIGLEWLFRLISEPRRLWRRYLVEPWFVLKLLLVDLFKKFNRSEWKESS